MYLTSGYVYKSASEAEKAFAGDIDRYVYSRYGNPDHLDVRGAAAADRRRRPPVLRRRREWRLCSRLWARCWPPGTGWSPRAACSDRASWCAARSCRAGVWRRCSSTVTTCRSGKRRCRCPPRRCSSRRRRTRCSSWLTSPRRRRPFTRRGGESGAGQRVRHTDPAAGLPAGRRRRGVFGHQAHRRAGPGARWCDPGRGDPYIDEPVQKLMRHTGPALSPFNAWTLLKGLETLAVRSPSPNSVRQRPRIPGEPSRGELGTLSVPGVASAVRPGEAPDDRWRNGCHVRARRRLPTPSRSARSRCSTSCGSSTSPTTSAIPSR